jgi:putative NADH-flavin reductase
MKLIVFGATGGTGKQTLERALAAGHEVTAFVRNPANLGLKNEKLHVVQGDALKSESVAGAISGHDAVVCAIGPRKGTPPAGIISGAVHNILLGMKQSGSRRFIFESGLMVGDGHALSWLSRTLLSIFRSTNRALYADKVIAEREILASDLDWTIVRPPGLAHSPAKGGYRVGKDLDVKLTKPVSHADVAELLVKLAAGSEHLREIVDVGY